MRRTLLALVLCASLVTTGCASCGYYYDDDGHAHQSCDAGDFVVGLLTGFVLVVVGVALVVAATDDHHHHNHHGHYGHYCD